MAPLPLLLATACGSTPVIPSSAHYKLDNAQMHAVAYTARGRGAYILRGQDNVTKLCSEPFPDAVANEAASRNTSVDLQASLTYAALATSLGLKSADIQSAAATISDVAKRTEVVLVLREALYRVCEANLNGTLTNKETKDVFDSILRTARIMGRRDLTTALTSALKSESTAEVKTRIINAIATIAIAEASASTDDKDLRKLLFDKAVENLNLTPPPETTP